MFDSNDQQHRSMQSSIAHPFAQWSAHAHRMREQHVSSRMAKARALELESYGLAIDFFQALREIEQCATKQRDYSKECAQSLFDSFENGQRSSADSSMYITLQSALYNVYMHASISRDLLWIQQSELLAQPQCSSIQTTQCSIAETSRNILKRK